MSSLRLANDRLDLVAGTAALVIAEINDRAAFAGPGS